MAGRYRGCGGRRFRRPSRLPFRSSAHSPGLGLRESVPARAPSMARARVAAAVCRAAIAHGQTSTSSAEIRRAVNRHSVFIPHLPQGTVLDASTSEELSRLQRVFSTKLCTLLLKTEVGDWATLIALRPRPSFSAIE